MFSHRPCGFLPVLQSKWKKRSSQSFSSSTCSDLPPTPRSSREKVLVQMRSREPFQQIAQFGESFISKIKLAPAYWNSPPDWNTNIMKNTLVGSSSRFGEIIKCRIPSATCMRILYPLSSPGALPQLWVHESEFGFMGASLDGVISRTSDDAMEEVLEIKCPYSAKNYTVVSTSILLPSTGCIV